MHLWATFCFGQEHRRSNEAKMGIEFAKSRWLSLFKKKNPILMCRFCGVSAGAPCSLFVPLNAPGWTSILHDIQWKLALLTQAAASGSDRCRWVLRDSWRENDTPLNGIVKCYLKEDVKKELLHCYGFFSKISSAYTTKAKQGYNWKYQPLMSPHSHTLLTFFALLDFRDTPDAILALTLHCGNSDQEIPVNKAWLE